jgi:hypothetical protein
MPYKVKERLYTTLDGKVVKEGDPKAAFLLMNEGGELSDEEAQKYGLVEEKAVPAPPATKARSTQASKGA